MTTDQPDTEVSFIQFTKLLMKHWDWRCQTEGRDRHYHNAHGIRIGTVQFIGEERVYLAAEPAYRLSIGV